MLKCYSYDIVCQEIPEEITLAVNVSCCPNRCKGCHSPWLWGNEGEEMTEEMLSGLIGSYSSAITCFCFMGGDADPLEVMSLSMWIKSMWPHIKTAWYSGRSELPDGFDVTALDYLKLGPYIEALGGLKSPETNQRLYKVGPGGVLERLFLK
jgi:anaerobic ribonucleoside-triphosphate reductase activating protein